MCWFDVLFAMFVCKDLWVKVILSQTLDKSGGISKEVCCFGELLFLHF